MKLHFLAAATLLALASASAQAGSQDLSFGSYAVTANKADGTPFSDTFNFSFAGSSGLLSASVIEYKLGQYVDIAWPAAKAFSVYSEWDGMGGALLSLGDAGVATGVFLVDGLPVPSHFSIVVQGLATGNGAGAFQLGLKGSYGLSVMAQPVPEPGTSALFLVGLAILAVPTLLRKCHDRHSLGGSDHA